MLNHINQIEPLFFKKDINFLSRYIKSKSWITEHSVNKKFEKNFSELVGCKYAVSFPNGTITLFAILKTLNLKKNDTVAVPSYTMVASANVVSLAGAKLEFIDISSKNLCMCPEELEKKLKKKKIRVVIYVTLNGRTGYINQIKNLCRKYKAILIEDSAHSIGSKLKKKHHGTFGLASSFSFSMPKIITTGQGGMVCTNNFQIYHKLKLFKNFGRNNSGDDDYKVMGYNFKFTDIQATLGISQLSTLKYRIRKKREIFNLYKKELSNVQGIEMINFSKEETPWFVDIYLKERDCLYKFLIKNKIFCRKVYPSLNKLSFFKTKQKCKISELYCKRGLWLPSSLNLKKKEIMTICELIKKFYDKNLFKKK